MRKVEVKHKIHLFWMFHDDLGLVDEVALKCRRLVIVPFQQWNLEQLHSNNMGIEKCISLEHQSIMLVKY